MEVLLMFPASVVKKIDENLKYIVDKIEAENSKTSGKKQTQQKTKN